MAVMIGNIEFSLIIDSSYVEARVFSEISGRKLPPSMIVAKVFMQQRQH